MSLSTEKLSEKERKKKKRRRLQELKMKDIRAIHPSAEGPLDDGLLYLKNKDMPVF